MMVGSQQRPGGHHDFEELVQHRAQNHTNQGRRNQPGPGSAFNHRMIPTKENYQRNPADEDGTPVDGAHRLGNFVERVQMVRLLKALITNEVVVIAHGVGDLLQDDHNADAGQHPLNYHVGNEVADHSGSEQSNSNLHSAGQEHRQSEGFEGLQLLNCIEHDHSQARGRTTDTEFGSGKERHDHTPNHACDDAAQQGRPRGQRHAQAQRQCDQEHHDTGGNIGTGVIKDRQSQTKPRPGNFS